jgi:glycine/D-amino acid oxidase-like deaminating enzyme
MLGLSLGPATGMLVRNILAKKSQPFDIELLKPDRFA